MRYVEVLDGGLLTQLNVYIFSYKGVGIGRPWPHCLPYEFSGNPSVISEKLVGDRKLRCIDFSWKYGGPRIPEI